MNQDRPKIDNGNPIRRYRIREGLTQKAFAERIGMGCTQGSVNQWEAWRSMPGARYAIAIARMIGVTVEKLVAMLDESNPANRRRTNRKRAVVAA